MNRGYRFSIFLHPQALNDYLYRISKRKRSTTNISIITKTLNTQPRSEIGPHIQNLNLKPQDLIVEGPAKKYLDSFSDRLHHNLKRGEILAEDMVFTVLSSFKLSAKQISRYVKIVERGGAILISERYSKHRRSQPTRHQFMVEYTNSANLFSY